MRGIVYGKTFKSASIKLAKIKEDYEKMDIKIKQHRKSCNQEEILFENNDIWLAVGASESSRGRACNVAYIDSDIDDNIVQHVLLPTIKNYPYQAYKYY